MKARDSYQFIGKVSINIAKKLLGILFIIIIFSNIALSFDKINSKIVIYSFGYNTYSIILPGNINNYKYLSHFPLTAFLFCTKFDESKIKDLSVKQLLSGSLGSTYDSFRVLDLSKLKGFEETAAQISNLDEFGIAGKKQVILTKLLETFKNYREEYEKYLQNSYTFRNYQVKDEYGRNVWKLSDDYATKSKFKIKGKDVYIYMPTTYWTKLSRNKYDFDKNVITLSTFEPRTLYNSGWEKAALDYFYIQCRKFGYKEHKKFPETLKVNVSIEDAKKLFGDNNDVFCETLFTVKLNEGFVGYRSGTFTYQANAMEIIEVTKNFYKNVEKSKIFTIEIDSSKDFPFKAADAGIEGKEGK